MSFKSITKVIADAPTHMVGDGFKVSNYIPGSGKPTQETSPFLVLDYNAPWKVPASDKNKGVGGHPHKGFETVTLVYEGELAHKDSSGGGGVIGEGDVQWMTAGSGIVHQEFQSDAFTADGGVQHMAQIWVNLPAKHKSAQPKYQSLSNDNMGLYPVNANGSVVRVVAGNFKGVKGPATTYTPLEMYDIRLKEGDAVTFDLPAAFNTMLLVAKGKVVINGEKEIAFKDFVLFGHAGETISIQASADSYVLVLSGEPIREPIASYGPFVMNTKEEIMEAINDYNAGKFGKIEV